MARENEKLMNTYEQIKAFVHENPIFQDGFKPVEIRFEEKKQNPDLSIMVYGVYNAGKSTFINALIGKEVAEMDDIPLTDCVTAYTYENYQILDTPGIDAPKEHEQVTEEQLLKSDAILFVVNPIGVAEELATLKVLMKLFARNKKVFLIFNEKQDISEEDFIKLKDQTRERLQELAKEYQLKSDFLSDIPILKFNAKRALQGKLKNKEKIIEASGVKTVEKELSAFLEGIGKNTEIYKMLKAELNKFIEHTISSLKQKNTSGLKQEYDDLLRKVIQYQMNLKKDYHNECVLLGKELAQNVKSWIYTDVNLIESSLHGWIDSRVQLLGKELETHFQQMNLELQDNIEKIQIKIPKMEEFKNHSQVKIDLNDFIEQPNTELSVSQSNLPSIDMSNLAKTMTQLSQSIKPEHIIKVLELTKEYFPTLMKGIGPKTMEKIAGTVISKYIPYVGPVISTGMALYDLASEQKEAQRFQQQIQEQELQRLRKEQYIQDTAQDIADKTVTELKLQFSKMIDEFFGQFIEFLEIGKKSFSEQEQENITLLSQLENFKQSLI